MHRIINPGLLIRPRIGLLIAVQFFSALADNALLIVTIALLIEQGLPAWWAALLKFGFTLSYVVLAPFVGPIADTIPKARLMAWMNGLKAVGVAGLAGFRRFRGHLHQLFWRGHCAGHGTASGK